jgi:hypothetical protein
MSMKKVCPVALVLILLGVGAVQGQYSMPPADGASPPGTATPGDAQAQAVAPGVLRHSSWITYTGPECCGPLCGKPILSELYGRVGASIPIAGKVFDDTLQTGWDLQAGGRLLFFNQTVDAAWVLDLSISNISNHGQNPEIKIPIQTTFQDVTQFIGPGQDVRETVLTTISNLNRTFVNFGLGRDWYLMGNALSEGRRCRVGLDGGFRWGTAKVEFHEIRHRTDVITGTFVSVHADVEIPLSCCTFLAGLRAEWDYTWLDDLLQFNDESLQDINLLFTAGIRF